MMCLPFSSCLLLHAMVAFCTVLHAPRLWTVHEICMKLTESCVDMTAAAVDPKFHAV